jgi:S-DNA-T family DNA segregation ATPase FtsK/SpoIIIE
MEKSSVPSIPHIIVMIDNLLIFKEVFAEYEDAMLNICREGLALGITVVATAKQTGGLSYRYLSNFSTRLAFNCTESTEYSTIFDKCKIQPKNVQGRGLVAIDKLIYEYQAFLPFDGETESQRIEQAKEFIAGIAKTYGAECARKVPSIPPVLTG